MKWYGVDVTYASYVTERTIVTAKDKEEAMEKIKNGEYDDVIDDFIENNEIVDFDFFQEGEAEEEDD